MFHIESKSKSDDATKAKRENAKSYNLKLKHKGIFLMHIANV